MNPDANTDLPFQILPEESQPEGAVGAVPATCIYTGLRELLPVYAPEGDILIGHHSLSISAALQLSWLLQQAVARQYGLELENLYHETQQ